MRRIMLLLSLFVFCLLAVLGTGCKDKTPQTDLDLFISEMSQLDEEARMVKLHELAVAGSPQSTYANYMIGNQLYQEAGVMATEVGWNGGEVNALLDSAEVFFDLAVAQDSTFLEAMVNLGSLWDDRSDQMGNRQEREFRVDKAKGYYNLALKVDPFDEKARCNLGALYLRQRQTSEALAQFQKVLENNPHSSLAHYNMAIMFAEQKIYREAVAEWELAVKYDPDGDIGSRSRDNIKIVKDLMNTPTPTNVK